MNFSGFISDHDVECREPDEQAVQVPEMWQELHQAGAPQADTNSKPFRCDECGRRFGRQDVLSRHAKLHLDKHLPAVSTPQTLQESSFLTAGTLGRAVSAESPSLAFATGAVSNPPGDGPHTPFEDSDDLLEWLMAGFNENYAPPLPLAGPSDQSNPVIPTGRGLSRDHTQLRGNSRPEAMGIQQLFKLIDDMSKRLGSDIDNNGITSEFLDACLHEFFERVSPAFPVIHVPTFSSQRTIPPLLLTMVALGSLFVCLPNAVQKGELLWRLGHTAVATSWRTLMTLRGPHDKCDGVQVVLTALLGQTYALLSSNADIRTTAFVVHGLGFYWARTCGMYSIQDGQVSLPDTASSQADKKLLWETWAASEVQRRAVLGHYILDGLISQSSGSPTNARHLINQIGGACSDEVFAAATVDQWMLLMAQEKPVRIPMCRVYTALFKPQYIQAPFNLSTFSVSVQLEGLQSLVSESHEVGDGTFGVVPRRHIIQALLSLHQAHISFAPMPETRLIRWHNICIELAAPSTALYRTLCATLNILPLLSGIPAALPTQVLDLEHWARSADAIRALLHSMAISPYLPMAIFSSAMVLSTVCLFGSGVLDIPSSPRWEDVWGAMLSGSDGLIPTDGHLGANEFLHILRGKNGAVASVNLVNDLNFLQLALRNLTSCWGVSVQMERVVGQLTVRAHERYAAGGRPSI
ncbi:hypothetical protein BDW62DRAFT_207838 [Aspergillus aurantiobrunneus]